VHHLPRLSDRAPRVDRDTEHVTEHRDADLNTYAGKKSDQDGARKEIGEKAELENPRQKQEPGGQKRHHADQCHVLLATGHRNARE